MATHHQWSDDRIVALVELVLSGKMSAKQAASQAGIQYRLVRVWVRQYRAGTLGNQSSCALDLWLQEPLILEIERRVESCEGGHSPVADWIVQLIARELELEHDPSEALVSPSSLDLELPTKDLPRASEVLRWNPRRRSILVQAVLSGQVTFEEACTRHGLEPQELRQWVARNLQLERSRCRIHIPQTWLARMEPRWREEIEPVEDSVQAAAQWVRHQIARELERIDMTARSTSLSRPFHPFGGQGYRKRTDRR